MKIENSLQPDIPKIFELYRIATDYMKSKNQVHWPEFSEELISAEVEEKRQWKLVIDNSIACIWATTLNDELIWGEKNNDPSLYLHRITTNPIFRGQGLLKHVIDWSINHCKEQNLQFLRLDTVGLNKGLIKHYEKHGFKFLGMKDLENTDGLPDHYKAGGVCFFEMEIV